MTHHDFNHLLDTIKTLTPEQMRQLRQELDRKPNPTDLPQPRPTLTEEQFKQELLEAGLMTSLPTPPDPGTPGLLPPLELEGEPLSETIIRERR